MYVDTKEPSKVTLEPSLRNLAYVLRHKEMWPRYFTWNFRYVDTCAMGMCWSMWDKPVSMLPDAKPSFTGEDLDDIFIRYPSMFWCLGRWLMGKSIEVTPEIVADRIDSYLKAA